MQILQPTVRADDFKTLENNNSCKWYQLIAFKKFSSRAALNISKFIFQYDTFMVITSPDIDCEVDGSYKLILFVIAKLTDIITAD